MRFIHELDGASFSEHAEGIYAHFRLWGGESVATGGDSAYYKLTPTLLPS